MVCFQGYDLSYHDMPTLWGSFAPQVGRIDAYSPAFITLLYWDLRSDKCFIANSTREAVTITNCTVIRCSFRDTSFFNVQFLNCTLVDMTSQKLHAQQ